MCHKCPKCCSRSTCRGQIAPESVQEVHGIAFSHTGQILPIQSTAVWSLHSPHGVHRSGQRGQISCTTKGYKDPPVPKRLVGQSQIPPNLSPTNTNLGSSLSGVGLASEQRQIRAGPQTSFQLRRLPVRSEGGQGQTHPRMLADPSSKDKRPHDRSGIPGPEANVPNRVTDSYRKASVPRPVTHEIHTVASQKQLEGTRVTTKSDSHTQIVPPSIGMVAGGKHCASRSTITPTKICPANLYRRIKRKLGRSLK